MISVIIPVYNVAPYLQACVESVQRQTYKDLQIILVDDGSTDASGAMCDRFAAEDDRIEVVHQGNAGLSGARNTGLSKARGEYIAFVDADDYIHPQMCGVLLGALDDERFAFSICQYKKVHSSADGMEIPPPISLTEVKVTELTRQDLYVCLCRVLYNVRSAWGKLYRRETLEGMSFRQQPPVEDVAFNAELYASTERAVLVNVEMYYYVQREGSIIYQIGDLLTLNETKTLLICLRNIPQSLGYCRAFCLEILYKRMLSARREMRCTRHSEAAMEMVRKIKSETYGEFIRNGHLPLGKRLVLSFFYYVPSFYNLFRWSMERVAALRHA